jgi:choline dehydrogenase
VQHRVKDGLSTNQLARGARLVGEVAKFFLRGNGALTFGVTTAQVFARSRDSLASPDLQLLFTPASYALGQFGVLERTGMTAPSACEARQPRHGDGASQTLHKRRPAELPPHGPTRRCWRPASAWCATFAQLPSPSTVRNLPGPGGLRRRMFAFNRQYGTDLPPGRHLPHGEDPGSGDARHRRAGDRCL